MRRFCVVLFTIFLVMAALYTTTDAEQTDIRGRKQDGVYTYMLLPDDTAEIVEYLGTDTTLRIPQTLGGHIIARIGDNAFNKFDNNNKLISVTLPEGLTGIGDRAFYSCELTSIALPDSLQSIGNEAFYLCNDLKSITLPGNLRSIGSLAFYGCGFTSVAIPGSVAEIGANPFSATDLKEIRVPISHPVFAMLDDMLFHKEKKELICCLRGYELTEATIPVGIRSIGDYAFYWCGELTSIALPDSLRNIGSHAFENCHNLTNIILPENLTSIGDYAFENCSELNGIVIPNSLTEMGADPFRYTGIMEVTVSAAHPVFAMLDGALYNKPEKKLIRYFGNQEGNQETTVVTIPRGIVHIGDSAFRDRSYITHIDIPDTVTSIGDYAFASCYHLTDIALPDSVTRMGNDAFSSCNNLSSIALSDGLIGIGDHAFSHCYRLTSIVLPENLVFIGNRSFDNCRTLDAVALPDSLVRIGDYAFSECISLTSVTIPDSVKDIGIYPFLYSGVQEIIISASHPALEITDGMLYNKVERHLMHCLDGVERTAYIVPDGICTIEYGALANCENLTSVVMPKSVTSIGEYAFFAWRKPVLTVIPGSYAEAYAAAHDIAFVYDEDAFYGWLDD